MISFIPISKAISPTTGWLTLLILTVFLPILNQAKAEIKTNISRIRAETIEVYDLTSGFHRSVLLRSIASLKKEPLSIYYSSFEKITKISVRYFDKNKDKFRKYRDVSINDFQAPSMDFYTSNRTRTIDLPENVPFQVNYETEVSDLIFLPQLHFTSSYEIDTFYYNLKVPAGLNLKYKVENAGTLASLIIDSSKADDFIIYSFTGVVNKPEEYRRRHSANDESILIRECTIKTIVTPKEFRGRESCYLNDWIQNRIKQTTVLSPETIRVIDSLTHGIISKDSIARILFEFVRSRIKYLNIEIGYGAFVPNDVNRVLMLHQGDCKDKASLLCQALVFKGMDARLVMTSTTGNYTQMDFPCIGIANHMICALRCPSSWMFLDPTEENGVYGQSGLMTQDRLAFIIGDSCGEFSRIRPLKPEENLVYYKLVMGCHGDSITGTFSISYKGKTRQELLENLGGISSEEKVNTIKSLLSLITRNLSYSHIRIIDCTDSLTLSGKVILANNISFVSDTLHYLSLDFIPRPIETTYEDPLRGDILLSHKPAKKVSFSLDLESSPAHINLKNFDYVKNGYCFHMTSSLDKNRLNVNYSFSYDDVIIPKESSDQYRQFKTFITNTFNNAIKFW